MGNLQRATPFNPAWEQFIYLHDHDIWLPVNFRLVCGDNVPAFNSFCLDKQQERWIFM